MAMRVAVYARVSTEAQEARGTIGSQIAALRERADAECHELVAEFVDDGTPVPAWIAPDLDALRDAAEAGSSTPYGACRRIASPGSTPTR